MERSYKVVSHFVTDGGALFSEIRGPVCLFHDLLLHFDHVPGHQEQDHEF